MIWILRIFNILIQVLTAFSVGDVAAHALEYDLSKSLIIRNVLLLLFCVSAHFILKKIEIRGSIRDGRKSGVSVAVFDLMIFVVVTVASAVLVELYFNYGLPKQVVLTALILLAVMLTERTVWIGADASGMTEPGRNPAVYLIFTSLRYLAEIGLGIFMLVAFRREENRLFFYLAMAGCAAVAVIAGFILQRMSDKTADADKAETEGRNKAAERTAASERNVAVKTAEGAEMNNYIAGDEAEDFDSWEYWERREKEELVRRRNRKLKGISFGIITVAVTTFLFFISPIVASVYLLSAFLIGVLLPMCFYRFSGGGSRSVAVRIILAGTVTCGVFQIILLLLAVWQVSFGAVWEYEFLMMLGIIIITEEYLLGCAEDH